MRTITAFSTLLPVSRPCRPLRGNISVIAILTLVLMILICSTAQAAEIIPGSGWVGPTAQPSRVGDALADYNDANTIARWDVIPYQDFNTNLNVGVVAFHSADINYVSFSVENGTWVNVSSMTLNSQTGVTEYWVTLNPADFNDVNIEVRAIAYPKTGYPRLLEGLTLYANHGKMFDSPVRYVASDGNDSNDGLTSTTAKQTILAAFKSIYPNGTTYYGIPINGMGKIIINKAGNYLLPDMHRPGTPLRIVVILP